MDIYKNKKLLPVIAALTVIFGSGYYAINIFSNSDRSIFYQASAANPTNPATADNSYIVEFQDANFKKALNEALATLQGISRTPSQNITAGEMRSITNLDFSDKNISDIEGIQFLANAKILNLKNNQLSTIKQLEFLTNLERLFLDNNQIVDISSLKTLIKLNHLEIGRNKITELSVLKNLTQLSYLNITLNQVTDISSLKNLPLTKFFAYGNNISNIEAIATLSNISQVDMGRNKVVDFSPLYNLNKLTDLNLNNLASDSATALQASLSNIVMISSLKSLNISDNKLTDVSAFKNTTNLRTLNIARNQITKVGVFKESSITRIDATNQEIDISTDQKITKSPIIGFDGKGVRLAENSDVRNVINNEDYYFEILKTGIGETTTTWKSTSQKTRNFSGKLKIKYNIDVIPPVFNPAVAAPITWRKGVPIRLDDISATDENSGLQSLTNNATEVGLNINNPNSGKYKIKYIAVDKAGNTATLERLVEITVADSLQDAINRVTDQLLADKTDETANEVKLAKAEAELIIADNSATQTVIDTAEAKLSLAIRSLKIAAKPISPSIKSINSNSQPNTPNTGVGNQLSQNDNRGSLLVVMLGISSMVLVGMLYKFKYKK